MDVKKDNNRVTNVKDSEKLSRDNRRRLLPKIISVLAAFCIWFYVVSVESPIVEKSFTDIPVEIELPSGSRLEAYSGLNHTVDITVKGKKSALRILSNEDFEAVMDMSSYKDAGTYNVSVDVETPSSATVVEQSVKELEVYLDTEEQKILQVEVETINSARDADVFIEKTAEPAEINVTGPGTVLNRISRAVVLFDCGGKIETEMHDNLVIELLDEKGEAVTSRYLKMSQTEANVTIKPKITKEVELALSIESLEEGDYEYTLSPDRVILEGFVSDIENNDPYIVESKLEAFKTFGEPVLISVTFDKGIIPTDAEFKEVEANVTLNYEEKVFEDIPITVTGNASKEYEFDQTLDITVKCIPSRIDELKKSDIKLSADLSKLEGDSCPVEIIISEEFEKIASVGEYKLSVKKVSD